MDGFKQRIVGALVLISLAVIFVPMLLDEPQQERQTRNIEIPQEPDFPEVRIEPAEEPTNDSPIEPVPAPESPPMETGPSSDGGQSTTSPMNAEDPVQPNGQPDGQGASTPAPGEQPRSGQAPAEDAATAPEPEVTNQPAPEPEEPEPAPATGGYLVQVGSFGSASNAQGLRDSVEEAGFTAYTTEIESGGKTHTRVFAGPFVDERAASEAKVKLDDEFGLNALVMVNDS